MKKYIVKFIEEDNNEETYSTFGLVVVTSQIESAKKYTLQEAENLVKQATESEHYDKCEIIEVEA